MTIPTRMMRSVSLRNRLFVTLFLVALVPSAVALVAGTLVLREVVVSTGTAGAWNEVAESGRDLLESLEAQEGLPPNVREAAEDHRALLGESVRMSRVYAFVGERVLGLLPFFALGLLVLAAGFSLVAANRLSRNLSGPVEELVAMTRTLGSGEPLPRTEPGSARRVVREFALLREALETASGELSEARAREAERIRTRSWAEMARRVAHDLKNPLTPMGMAADRVARSPDPAAAEAGRVLQEEIRRLDALARSFAQFGRPPEGPRSVVDLKELLAGLAGRLGTPELPVETHLPDEPVEIRAYLEPLERAIRNLVANAQEAEAGSRPSDGSVGPRSTELHLASLPSGAEIRILDRGPGIPPEMMPRIWDPEFTTKRRGTGLGLSMVRQVVEAHGGEVEARNRQGGGAEFRIVLPATPPDAPDPGSLPRPGPEQK